MNSEKTCQCGGEVEVENLANIRELVCQECGRVIESEVLSEPEQPGNISETEVEVLE